MHRMIAQVLRSLLLREDETRWPAKLPYVELAINANPNASTLKPAFEVLYGENVPMPVDYALAKPDGVHPSAAKFTQHIHTIIKQT